MKPKVDYKAAGVDIEAGNEAVRRIKAHVISTHSKAVLTGLGSFGSAFSLKDALRDMKDPVMVQSTDGVGTKTLVSAMAGRYEGLGRDLIGNVMGDIVVMGAKPLTFLDYIGVHKINPAIMEQILCGISAGCVEAGAALVGGEMAEMPSVYAEGDLDLVGFATGVVDRDKIITGQTIQAGDVIYALNSSGIHTNGFSLARKLVFGMAGHDIHDKPAGLNGVSVADALLTPHINYAPAVGAVLDTGIPVLGMAHITGGGLVENVPRIVPDGLHAVIDRATWTPQPVFGFLQAIGQVEEMEMLRTFNMGVGLVMIAPPGQLSALEAALKNFLALQVWELGRVVAGGGPVEFVGK
jgi:phosphoribosylformylglycinamidine cyclo-ligase